MNRMVVLFTQKKALLRVAIDDYGMDVAATIVAAMHCRKKCAQWFLCIPQSVSASAYWYQYPAQCH